MKKIDTLTCLNVNPCKVTHSFVLLIMIVMMAIPASAAIPESNELRFQILRNGNPFGVHTVNFSETSEGYTKVDIHIKMSVGAGPITLFNYEHFNTEIWDGNRLVSLSSETDDNGDDYFVNAKWKDGQFDIQSSSRNQKLDKPVFSSSYWHPTFVRQPQLLNSQKGNLDTIEIIDRVQENLTINKINYLTNRYTLRVNDEKEIKIWYDDATKEWMSLDFTIRGQNITYKRIPAL